ncbi:5397_t:CDS:10 [Diversispora eburnea]|uniref:5397_t:CDS:1 n=1 Tax=Diversispora eburnea TaxID=1213867 RepID=A0A9N8YSP3_9GLOM|nr:5397_t:CDS:10 [Diversispora eburnea]
MQGSATKNSVTENIDMDAVRWQFYNTQNITELRAALETIKMLKLYKEYLFSENNPIKLVKCEHKWERCMNKLKFYVSQMRKHGSKFTISQDLIDCKLSEIVEMDKLNNSINNQTSTFNIIEPSTENSCEIFIGENSQDSKEKIKEETKCRVRSLSNVDTENLSEHSRKEIKNQKSNNVLGPVIAINKDNCKVKLPSGNQIPINNCIHKKSVVRRNWQPLTFQKQAIRSIGHNHYEILDNKKDWKENSDGCIELLDSDEDDKTVVIISSEDEESIIKPTNSKKPNLQIEIPRQRRSIINSALIEMNPFDLEANEYLAHALLEQELNKKALIDRRDYKIQRAIEIHEELVIKKDLPKDIDELASLMSYLVENDLTLDSDGDSSTLNVDKPLSDISQEIDSREERIKTELVRKLSQLNQFSFKCGSGDVNEIALDYSNPEAPKVAVAYIANSDPNYNTMGNLQFLDMPYGTVYNMYGHLEGDERSKQDLWTTVTDVKFTPDGKLIFSASTDCSIKIWKTWDYPDFHNAMDTKVCKSKVHRISVSPRPERGSLYQFAACEDSGIVSLYTVRQDRYGDYSITSTEFVEEKWKYNESLQNVSSDVIFGPDNNLIAGYYGSVGRKRGIIKVWDIGSRRKECKNSVFLSSSASCLDISHDGRWIACGTTACTGEIEGDGSVYIWDIKSKKTITSLTKEKDANVISISPNDQFIALGGTSNKSYVFDKRNMNKALHLLKHNDPCDGLPHDGIMSLQWIPNSNILLSGGNDSIVRVWNIDVSSRPLVYKFENHDSPVTSIRISPDLKFMAVGVSTGKMYIYSTNETLLEKGKCLKYL